LAVPKPDGSFGFTGPAAHAYARQLCPAPPKLSSVGEEDARCITGAIHCLKLYKTPTATITRDLKAYCSNETSQLEASGVTPDAGWCAGSQDGWQHMLATQLPITLR
jgi:hypothetical protein